MCIKQHMGDVGFQTSAYCRLAAVTGMSCSTALHLCSVLHCQDVGPWGEVDPQLLAEHVPYWVREFSVAVTMLSNTALRQALAGRGLPDTGALLARAVRTVTWLWRQAPLLKLESLTGARSVCWVCVRWQWHAWHICVC